MIPIAPAEFWQVWLVKIPVHGLFALIGLIFGLVIILGIARKQKIHPTIILAEAFWVLAGAWIGSKLLYYLGPYDICCRLGLLGMIGRGFVFYGGIIGGIFAGYVYTKSRHYNFWKHLDFWGLGIPLGIFIARLGCFLVNDAPGKITSVAWAVQLPDMTARHPAGLYLSLLNLVLFVYLYSKKSAKKFDGQIFLQYLMLCSAGTFIIEFFRVYTYYFLSLTFSQWLSIAIFISASVFYVVRLRSS